MVELWITREHLMFSVSGCEVVVRHDGTRCRFRIALELVA